MQKVREGQSGVNGRLPVGAALALENLLQSRTLESRPRLREFLRFVGVATLEGRAHEIKEHAIGVEVFGRHPDYSVHDDTIVRVTARQLRQKIDEYNAGEGRDAKWVIEIPRGTYVPVFHERPPGQPAVSIQSGAAFDLITPAARVLSRPWLGWIVATVLAVFCAVLLMNGSWRQAKREPTLLGLMSSFPGQQINVVCGDGVVQIFKELTGNAPTVDAYESSSYLHDPSLLRLVGDSNPVWDELKNRQLLATGSLQSLTRLIQAMPDGQLSARHPRNVSIRDFVDGNAILLSGPFANPWVQLFEPKLNFRIEQDTNRAVFVRNVEPKAGELPEYHQRVSQGNRTSYARLAYMPNLSGKGRILLIGGPSSALMELMGSAVSEPNFLRQMADRFGIDDPSALPYCEILMEVDEMAGAPVKTRVVAVRRLSQ